MPGATSTASCAGVPSGAGWSSSSGWRWPTPPSSVAGSSAAPGPTIAGKAVLAAAHERLLAQALSHSDLQAILAHLTDDPDELLTGTGADRPVLAVRVRATVGRPGGSAQATWRRARAAEWATWTRTLPWRLAVIVGIGAGGGLLGSLLAPRLGLVLGGLAAIAAGWG